MAEAVREEMLIPYCNKHNYKFKNDNGAWTFYTDRGLPIDPAKIDSNIFKALECKPFQECDKISKSILSFQPIGFVPTY